jgi:hypothetical protein
MSIRTWLEYPDGGGTAKCSALDTAQGIFTAMEYISRSSVLYLICARPRLSASAGRDIVCILNGFVAIRNFALVHMSYMGCVQ